MSSKFVSELRRRNVHKVAFVYALLAWLVLAAMAVFFRAMEVPDGLFQFFAVVIAIGFPLALFVAWRFEMTPRGMTRTEHLQPHERLPYWSKRKFAAFVAVVVVLAAALMLYQYASR